MGLKGNVSSLRKFSDGIRRYGHGLADAIAKRAAPLLTAESKKTFAAGTDPYGVPWTPAKDGTRVDLVKDGTMSDFLFYKSLGRFLRVALGVEYAKYQIGRRPVFPTQDGALPEGYVRALKTAEDATHAAQWRAMSEGR